MSLQNLHFYMKRRTMKLHRISKKGSPFPMFTVSQIAIRSNSSSCIRWNERMLPQGPIKMLQLLPLLQRHWLHEILPRYWVILKKVSSGIFRIILVSKEEKKFTIECKDKGLSLSQFSSYLVIVKIMKIWHLEGHISH